MSVKIFISYRWGDTFDRLQNLHEDLNSAFGEQSVFIDVEDIPRETSIEDVINKNLRRCDVLLAVIGPKWLDKLKSRGDSLSDLVRREIVTAFTRGIPVIPVIDEDVRWPPPEGELPERLQPLTSRNARIIHRAERDADIQGLIQDIKNHLDRRRPLDEYFFAYEKDIIETYINEYMRSHGVPLSMPEGVAFLKTWPQVTKQEAAIQNRVTEKIIGKYRTFDPRIIVDVRTHSPADVAGDESKDQALKDEARRSMTFPEAGPREMLSYDPMNVRVGILVSGGIAPGINAVIDGIVDRHILYAQQHRAYDNQIQADGNVNIAVKGYIEGFKGLLQEDRVAPKDMLKRNTLVKEDWVESQAHTGGSIIGTSRADELMGRVSDRPETDADQRDQYVRQIVSQLSNDDNIDILYVIGGGGSMRAAHAIWNMAQRMHDNYLNNPNGPDAEGIKKKLSVVAIPKTMDNDILWVWQAFGFLSAVEKAREAVLQLYTEVRSNPRLCVIQLFGSDSGFVVSHTALASGLSDYVLIPEVEFTREQLAFKIKKDLVRRHYNNNMPWGMVLMAETAIPKDIDLEVPANYVHLCNLDKDEKDAIRHFIERGRRVYGQTPDHLRTGGLKIVTHILKEAIKELADKELADKELAVGNPNSYWKSFRVTTNEPRHLLRAIAPSVSDVIFGQRLGALAVDNALAGYTDFMVSQWVTEFVLVPLELVVLGRKRVPEDGIFWKSVLAKTGQPSVERHV